MKTELLEENCKPNDYTIGENPILMRNAIIVSPQRDRLPIIALRSPETPIKQPGKLEIRTVGKQMRLKVVK